MSSKKYLLIMVLFSLAFGACKKESKTSIVSATPEDEIPPATSNRLLLSQDSIFLYAKQVYYWNANLPTYKAFNPRGYVTGASNMDKYNAELLGIAKYSSNKYDIYKEDGVYQNETKYSYISDITAQNPTGAIRDKSLSVDLEGNGNDIGLRLVAGWLDGARTTYGLFVTAVYEGSPAYIAGMKRGMVINKVNGVSYGANFASESAALNNALNGGVVSVEGRSLIGGATFSYTLTKTPYTSSPIYASKVITAGSKKIGYVALARFSRLTNSSGVLSDEDIDPIFQSFVSAGVTDLVIDLRYNGGGYIQTAEYIINSIVPSSLNGKVMYAEHYNSTMQNNKATILKNQPLPDNNGKVQYVNGNIVTYFDYQTNPYSVANNTFKFSKKGTLGVQNVVFLVTDATASSSELLINSLKPHLNVKVVGLTTYGKPVGFYPIVIENRYKVYYAMFETKNSLGQGGYYNGINPDNGYDEALDNTQTIWDDIRYEFGDVREGYLATALKILAPGSTVVSTRLNTVMSVKGTTANVADVIRMKPIKGREFVGMIDDRPRLKK